MVGTRDASEIKGPLVDGPVVDWTDGPVVDVGYLTAIARAHEESGFDRVLVGYGAVGPEGWAVASHVLQVTKRLKVLVAHRPGLVVPSVLARMAATLDHLSGGGRIAIHVITGGDEADQRREGDFVRHDDRYRRSGELMGILRRLWSEPSPFDHSGEFYRGEAMFSSVKPVSPDGIQLYFAGASAPAVEVGAALADVYAFWGEPRAAVTERMAKIDAAAARRGRAVRYSISLRPIVAETEDKAWQRADWIERQAAERIERARRQVRRVDEGYAGLGSVPHATYSLDRDPHGTTSAGRKRLIAMAESRDVYDERLWMRVAHLTGAAGNSTALVGTPEQVADALLAYCDLGISTVLLKGFDPLEDAAVFGERLIPLLRSGAAERDDHVGALGT